MVHLFLPKGVVKMFKLMVSHNLGASYHCEHMTEDREDPVLAEKIKECSEKMLRCYIDGDMNFVCDLHKAIVTDFNLRQC